MLCYTLFLFYLYYILISIDLSGYVQCFPISDHVSFPREYDSLFQLYPYACVFSCTTIKQRNDSLGNDTCSEMGKLCNATKDLLTASSITLKTQLPERFFM